MTSRSTGGMSNVKPAAVISFSRDPEFNNYFLPKFLTRIQIQRLRKGHTLSTITLKNLGIIGHARHRTGTGTIAATKILGMVDTFTWINTQPRHYGRQFTGDSTAFIVSQNTAGGIHQLKIIFTGKG